MCAAWAGTGRSPHTVRTSTGPLAMPDGQTTTEGAAAHCDCRKILGGLAECRSVFKTLSEEERLAVLCTLASELGLTISQKPLEAHDGSTRLHGPDGLEWAREFVSQVVLSDALVGAALRLDESKREIDDIAKRLERVAADSPAPLAGSANDGMRHSAPPDTDGRLDALERLVRDYQADVNPPLEALCSHAQQLLERAQVGSVDAEIALAIAEEAARVAEISIRLKEPATQA